MTKNPNINIYTLCAYNCKLNILIIVYQFYRNKIFPWHVDHFQTSSTLKYIGVCLSKKGNIICICEWMQVINIFNNLINVELPDLPFVIKYNMLIPATICVC